MYAQATPLPPTARYVPACDTASAPSNACEADHRIANSLQLLSAMIGREAHAVTDRASRAALLDTQARLAAIAGLHRRLYAQDLGLLDLRAYLDDLADSMRAIIPANIFVSIHGVAVRGSSDHARAFGMLVTELVMNACKHAYAPGAAGIIAIRLRAVAPGIVELSVEDRGRGKPVGTPADTAPANAASIPNLGDRVIDACVARLGGESRWEDASPGTRFSVCFPIPETGEH